MCSGNQSSLNQMGGRNDRVEPWEEGSESSRHILQETQKAVLGSSQVSKKQKYMQERSSGP